MYEFFLNLIKEMPVKKHENNFKFFTSKNTKLFAVGDLQVDSQMSIFNKAIIRKKYNIPKDKNIFLYLPFPFNPSRNQKCSYAWQAVFSGYYCDLLSYYKRRFSKLPYIILIIYSIFMKTKFLFKILSDLLSIKWFFRQLNEIRVLKSIKKFCELNDLFLVVKSRHKSPLIKNLNKYVDLVIADDEIKYFPSVFQELLSISKINSGYFSTAVREAVRLNCFFLNIQCPDLFLDNNTILIKKHPVHSQSMYNYHNVIKNMSIEEIIYDFSSQKISDFKIDFDESKKYQKKYLGIESISSATKIINYLKNIKN